MQTPEGKIKAKVKKLLIEYGVYSFMPVQAGYGKPGLDFHCIFMGRAFCIETKKPGGKPTARQELTIREIVQAGGEVFVIDGDTDKLKRWLNNVVQTETVMLDL
jgi:hypothetical protein